MNYYLYLCKPALHLQLNHFECTSYAATQNPTVSQRCHIGRQFNKFRQWICVENEREFIGSSGPIRDRRLHIQIHAKCLLDFVGRFAHVETTCRCCARQKVFDEPNTHVVTDPFQLLIHIVDVLEIANNLRHQCTIGQCQQFRILKLNTKLTILVFFGLKRDFSFSVSVFGFYLKKSFL